MWLLLGDVGLGRSRGGGRGRNTRGEWGGVCIQSSLSGPRLDPRLEVSLWRGMCSLGLSCKHTHGF